MIKNPITVQIRFMQVRHIKGNDMPADARRIHWGNRSPKNLGQFDRISSPNIELSPRDRCSYMYEKK